MYWTQKGSSNARQGRILRAGIDIPDGDTTPERRRDVAVIFKDLPEPIDLELDLVKRTIYWTGQRDPPLGNTVNRAPMDVAAGDAPQVPLGALQEAIGLLLDLTNRQMFFTDLGGSLYAAAIYGADLRVILEDKGHLTGVAYAEPINRMSSDPSPTQTKQGRCRNSVDAL